MNFDESVKYLYALGNEVLAMKLGLENITKLLAALGHPERNYLKVQIAGTNGKGSTCAFLEAIAQKSGLKVGLTTSPHLISVTERVRIGGTEISEEDFAEYATKVRQTAEKVFPNRPTDQTFPTFFEQVTAIALLAFAEQNVELAILETGLGGRFDATTAARAEIVAITSIDLDHQRILGDTLAEIAAEKAAVIRSDTRVVCARQKAEAEQVIKLQCYEKGVQAVWAKNDFEFAGTVANSLKQTISFRTEKQFYPNVLLSLRGRHQAENAEIALKIAEILQSHFEITGDSIIAGLESAVHRGRLELDGGFLFDGAHNASGARALREFLDEFISRKIVMVFGTMRDKDLSEIAADLFPKAEKLVLTKPDNPRSMETAEIIEFLPENFPPKNMFETDSVRQAIDKARELAAPDDLILITGSLYLIGEAQKILREKV